MKDQVHPFVNFLSLPGSYPASHFSVCIFITFSINSE